MNRFLIIFACLAVLLPGCATAPADPQALSEFKANNDPFEPMNRKTFEFNMIVDKGLIKPVAKGYRRAVPDKGRLAIRNFLVNLSEPLVLVNTLLQGRWQSSGTTLARLLINSTAGLGGLFDVAKKEGLSHQIGDFGQTLHFWGFGEGPYLIIPVVGPSNPRDLVGSIADIYGDPFRYVADANNYPTAFSVGRGVVSGIDKRAENIDTLDELQKESIDFYAALRSLSRQNRAGEIDPGKPPQPADFYDTTDPIPPKEEGPQVPLTR